MIDTGIKLFQLPIRIRSAASGAFYHSSLGFAFAGGAIDGMLIRERLAEVLINLGFCGELNSLTADHIVDVARAVFEHSFLGDSGCFTPDFFLMFYCPSQGTPHVFKFSSDIDGLWKEVLTTGRVAYDTIGTVDAFKILADEVLGGDPINIQKSMLETLRLVIHNQSISAVGGDIQYGELKWKSNKGDFALLGIHEVRMDGDFVRPHSSFRGIDIEELHTSDLAVEYKFIEPFDPPILKVAKVPEVRQKVYSSG